MTYPQEILANCDNDFAKAFEFLAKQYEKTEKDYIDQCTSQFFLECDNEDSLIGPFKTVEDADKFCELFPDIIFILEEMISPVDFIQKYK